MAFGNSISGLVTQHIDQMQTSVGKESYLNYLWKNIPNLGAVLLLDGEGELIDHLTSEGFKKRFSLVWNLRNWNLTTRDQKLSSFKEAMVMNKNSLYYRRNS